MIVVVVIAAAMGGMFYTYVDQAEFLAGEETSRGQIFGRDFLSFWMASLLAQTDRMAEIFDPNAFSAALSAFTGMDLAFIPFPYPPPTPFGSSSRFRQDPIIGRSGFGW